jgi:elongation factor Ts
MTKVTPDMVKELRERTGVGMGKCKEALDQAHGDMEKAIDLLRKSGMASAVKKEGRETKEGIVVTAESKDTIALVEINAETDFVVQNDRFKQFVQDIAQQAAATKPASLEAFLEQKYSKDPSLTLDQHRAIVMQSLGENIRIRRLQIFPKSSSHSLAIYSHMGGKIVTLVELDGGAGQEVPADVKAREEEIARGQVAGKPAAIMDKIVEGKLKAFYDQVCLLRQKFVKDNAITIAELVAKEGQRLGKPLAVRRFVRWQIGA